MALDSGARLGPYRVLGPIGAGGMGEVYRARDERLGRDVAVKVLPDDVARDPQRRQRFEREARAAGTLNHPNVLVVHDVGTEGGLPYLVTELLAGQTLRQRLASGPLTVAEAVDCAAQATRGLAAAHARGIVHRDLKPENLFLTNGGVVKVLDFGLARIDEPRERRSAEVFSTRPGAVMGTVGYMSPEQVRGEPGDPRSDIFSLGATLHEAISGRQPFRRATPIETLAAILNEEPAGLASATLPPALERIVVRCLEKRPEDRFHSAHDLALAFEVLRGVSPHEAAAAAEAGPYPGLRSFGTQDAELFFGREDEVAALWAKLECRSLLAVVGASGAGKTSFVRAGVVAAAPPGWAAVVMTPGTAPVLGLAQALAGELAGDADAVRELLRFEDPEVAISCTARWRRAHAGALLVVDQFEELFTLNPPEVQASFAALLGRLAGQAHLRVLLSLRDDFLLRCQEQAPLRPVFAELTPLGPLGREALRRALVEPARRRGCDFEDEGLVGQMVDEVAGERGALPLLAFAVSRLWERRDRQASRLTRAAYAEIGGVAGALAQHAESTLERVGRDRQEIVREIFRNLVTSQGTRAVASRGELLSVCPQRDAAADVLGQLIDARLLTSYRIEGAAGQPGDHRVEIVHESLLAAWPRLVRWRAQDEEGAVLRDQLKQAAHLWQEKRRSPDLLWTGTAYQEFALWRDRYTASLTALEEDFAKAMRQRARRRRRRATAGIAVSFAVLLGVTSAVAVSRQQAIAARSRAEASRLVALGRVELDRNPTAALAYARRSLETADNAESRRLAVEALWRAPSARILALSGNPSERAAFSADGRRFAAYEYSEYVLLHDDDGAPPRRLGGFVPLAGLPRIAFSPRGDALVTGWWETAPGRGLELRLREVSVPDGGERRRLPADPTASRMFDWAPAAEGVLTFSRVGDDVLRHDLVPWEGGPPRALGAARRAIDFAPVGDRLYLLRERQLRERPLEGPATSAERTVAALPPGKPLVVQVSPRGEPVVTLEDERGKYLALFLRDSKGAARPRLFRMAAPDLQFPPAFDARGQRLAWGSSANQSVSLWDLDGPQDAEPLVLQRPGASNTKQGLFDPRGAWLAVANHESFTFWATSQPWVRVLRRHSGAINTLQFTRDSPALVSCAVDGVGVWPMAARDGAGAIQADTAWCQGLTISGDGRQTAWLRPSQVLVGSPPGRVGRQLYHQDGPVQANCGGAAFDTAGRRLAVGVTYARRAQDLVMRVFDVASGAERVIPLVPPGEAFNGYMWGAFSLAFTPDGRLLAGGPEGVRRFDPDTGASEWLWRAATRADPTLRLAPDGRTAVIVLVPWDNKGVQPRRLVALDMASRKTREIATHGQRLTSAAISPSGEVLVTGDDLGIVRAGPIAGGEPHLLMGHAGAVAALAVSPDGRWIASAAGTEIRLWPMPDVAKPPLHTLPHDALLAKLRALTNLRVVEDPAASTGYRLDLEAFPGWKDVATW